MRRLKELELAKVENSYERKHLLYDEWKRQFGRMDKFLDAARYGPTWLSEPEIAELVAQAFYYFDDVRYRLDAFSILSNHAHLVLSPLAKSDGSFYALRSIMHSLKSFTANKANTILGRSSKPFWQGESYDHVIRNEPEWQRVMMYVLNNPVNASLVESWDKWQWTYCKYT